MEPETVVVTPAAEIALLLPAVNVPTTSMVSAPEKAAIPPDALRFEVHVKVKFVAAASAAVAFLKSTIPNFDPELVPLPSVVHPLEAGAEPPLPSDAIDANMISPTVNPDGFVMVRVDIVVDAEAADLNAT